MTTNTLSSVAGDIIVTCAQAARHVVQGCLRGSEKLAGSLDARWESGVTRRAARLSPLLREDLVRAERELTGLVTRGLTTLGSTTRDALGGAARLAVAGVDQWAAAIARFEPVVGEQAAHSLRVVAMPPVRALADLTHGVAGRTIALTDRVLGLAANDAAPAPATARRAAPRKATRRAA